MTSNLVQGRYVSASGEGKTSFGVPRVWCWQRLSQTEGTGRSENEETQEARWSCRRKRPESQTASVLIYQTAIAVSEV